MRFAASCEHPERGQVAAWRAETMTLVVDGVTTNTLKTHSRVEITSYTYDGLNRRTGRIETRDSGTSTPDQTIRTGYFYDGSTRLGELALSATAGTTTTDFHGAVQRLDFLNVDGSILALDDAASATANTVTVWAYSDLKGNLSTFQTETSDGLSLRHVRYDETGNVTFSTTVGAGTNGYAALNRAPLVWKGLSRDADTGLVELGGGRQYDPRTGRSLSDLGGLNGYSPFGNNTAENYSKIDWGREQRCQEPFPIMTQEKRPGKVPDTFIPSPLFLLYSFISPPDHPLPPESQTESTDMSQSDVENDSPPSSQVQMAIYHGDLDLLKTLGEKYPEAMHRDHEGGSQLHMAIALGRPEIVEYLLDFGLDVNERYSDPLDSPKDRTPLESGMRSQSLQMADLLLKRGANPNLGRPLIRALSHKDRKTRVPLMKLLVEHGVDVNQLFDNAEDQMKLFSALDEAKGDCRDYLLSIGAKTLEQLLSEERQLGEVYDRSGKKFMNFPPPKPIVVEKEPTPDQMVARAISRGDLAELKVLAAKYPEEIRAVDVFGNRLFWAVSSGHTHVIHYLLDAGLDVNFPVTSPPLNLSITFPNMSIAQILLKRGADPNLGRPLISALNCDDKSLRLPFLKLLVEHGADVNQLYDIYGDQIAHFSALDWAGEKGECRDYLLSVGAKSSDDLKKEGRKFGEVYDRSGKKIRDTPPPKPKAEPEDMDDEDTNVFASDVVSYFTQEIGTPDPKSLIEIVPAGMPITVHSIPATAERPYVTLFTTGLSAAPMNVPEEMTASEEYERAELYIQLPADWKYTELKDPKWNWPMLQLRRLAKAPHLEETWLGTPVTIIPNGDPPKPLAANAPFDSLMLVPDKSFPGTLGTVIQLYRVMPLYPEERELEAKQGHAALMRALDKVNTPFIVDLNRKNAARK